MYGMNPHGHRCCQHNSGHGWPYFNHHLWYASEGDGLAAFLYAPCRVTAKVADGVEVLIEEQTRYPFEDSITLSLQPARPVRFPLYLRIPGWCDRATLQINGQSVEPQLPAGKVVRVEREWRSGDRMLLRLPADIRVTNWTNNRNTVSVTRGPLTYSLRIQEKYVRYGGTEIWPALDIFPDSTWNYGLELDPDDPLGSLHVRTSAWPQDDRPFSHAGPLSIEARARRIPGWRLEPNGLVQEVVEGPIRSEEPRETVTLIPMGAARLRITAFPRIDNGPSGKDWPAASHATDPLGTSPGKATPDLRPGGIGAPMVQGLQTPN
jgi:hypothetical protein